MRQDRIREVARLHDRLRRAAAAGQGVDPRLDDRRPQVGQHAVVRDRELRAADDGLTVENVVRQRERIAGELAARRIEVLDQQRPLADVEGASRRRVELAETVGQRDQLLRVERAEVAAFDLRRVRAVGVEDELAAVADEVREAMRELVFLQRGDGDRLAARGRHGVERIGAVRREEDRPVRMPGPAAAVRRIGDRLHAAAGERDAAQLAT